MGNARDATVAELEQAMEWCRNEMDRMARITGDPAWLTVLGMSDIEAEMAILAKELQGRLR